VAEGDNLENLLVFIGKGLNEHELRQGFLACEGKK
jgi:hypothetical protein